MTRVVQGKDGKFYTVEGPAPIDLEKARRECRDVIQGNVPFHVDPFTPRPQAEVEPVRHEFCECITGLYLCDWCRDA